MTKKEMESKLNELEKMVLDSRLRCDTPSNNNNYEIHEKLRNIEYEIEMMRLEKHEEEMKEEKKKIDRELEECRYRRNAIENRRYSC